MKQAFLLTISISLFSAIAGCSFGGAHPGVPKEDPELVSNAQQVAEDLGAENYDAVYARFDDTMRQQLPASKLRDTVESLTAQHGAITGFGPAQAKTITGMDAVDMGIEFERGSYLLRLAYDDTGKIAGLWILAI